MREKDSPAGPLPESAEIQSRMKESVVKEGATFTHKGTTYTITSIQPPIGYGGEPLVATTDPMNKTGFTFWPINQVKTIMAAGKPEVARLTGAEKPGSSTFAMGPGTWTTTSDGRKVRVIYAGPWSWRAKSESRVVVLYWPDKDEYSTHEQNMNDLAFYSGHYTQNFSSVLEDFEERTGIRPPESVFRTKGLPG